MREVDTWTGADAQLLRIVALRLTVRDFAAELGITARTVSKWEQIGAARRPRPHFQAMFDTLLDRAEQADRARFMEAIARRGTVGCAGSGRDGAGVDRREFNMAVLAVGGALALPDWAGMSPGTSANALEAKAVGTVHVEALRAAADQIRQRDQHVGGGALLNEAAHCLTRAKAMLDTATYSSEVGTALMAATGDLAMCAGWVAYDADRRDLARQWYSDALALAAEAGDDDLAVHALQNAALLAMSPSGSGSPSRAMQLSERSRIIARNIRSSRLHALIASRTAIAHAAIGDRSNFERAIGTAWREVEHAEGHEPTAETPIWLRFIVPAEVRYHEARGRAYLGDLDEAAAVFHAGAEEQTDPRNATNYRAALAATLARSGDTSTAITEGVTVLTSLEGTVSSWRTLRQLEPVRAAATGHNDGEDFHMRFDKLKAISSGAA
ncbi:MAG: helix-turn-helix domain-containing protein [Pseudonocardiaceae bacterium]